ncbi:MAG: hypothetical protein NT069_07645 [Planctomycetota bacterium]|nr:hypothetical protein [Planctomycetota bacterium]
MVRLAIWLLVLGIGSIVLPMMGMQFKLLSALGDNAPYVGGGMAAIGLVLLILGTRGNQKTDD